MFGKYILSSQVSQTVYRYSLFQTLETSRLTWLNERLDCSAFHPAEITRTEGFHLISYRPGLNYRQYPADFLRMETSLSDLNLKQMSNSVSAMVKSVLLSRVYNTQQGASCPRDCEARSQISRQWINGQEGSGLIKREIK